MDSSAHAPAAALTILDHHRQVGAVAADWGRIVGAADAFFDVVVAEADGHPWKPRD